MQVESKETAEATMSPSGREGKYLTFVLDDEEYGLEILKVKEIIGIMNITPHPNLSPGGEGKVRGMNPKDIEPLKFFPVVPIST